MTERLQDKYRRILLARGESEVSSQTTTKRVAMTCSWRGEGWFIYLGKAGSVRVGRTFSGSIPTRLKE